MTKGEWLAQHQVYVSNQNPDDEATEKWIHAMETLLERFDEIYEDTEE